MKTAARGGFTLIELLTVIAIIAILAGLGVMGLSRAMENAKITDAISDFEALERSLAQYYVDNGSYPPGYGYIIWGSDPSAPDWDRYWLRPYVYSIGLFRAFDAYDRFSLATKSHDTDGNGYISPLEFCPVGDGIGGQYTFPDVLWAGDQGDPEVLAQLEQQRPYAYFPVNLRQFEKLMKYYYRQYTDTGDPSWLLAPSPDWAALDIQFPPSKYDAYVLISPGPRESTGGILALDGESGEDAYHKLAMRAYFLATRDANDNGKLDFDFQARTRNDEGKLLIDMHPALGLLPDGKPLEVPMIFKHEG